MLMLQSNTIFVYHSQLHNNKNRKTIYFLVYWPPVLNDLLIGGLRAEKTLFSDSSNNEILIINLETVQAERNTIFPPAQSCKT